MTKFFIPPPLKCEEVRERFIDSLKGKLDVLQSGRIKGHLLSCEGCYVAFTEAIDKAIIEGMLPQPAVPPVPQADIIQPMHKRSVSDLLPSELPAAYDKVGIIWQWAINWKDSLEQRAKGAVDLITLRFERFIEFLQSIPSIPCEGHLEGHLLVPSLGDQVLSYPVIKLVDCSWNDIEGQTIACRTTEKPVITVDGEFRLTLEIDEGGSKKYEGRKVICTMKLVEGGRVSFEAIIQQGQIKFIADGLPRPGADIVIPFDLLEFYLAP